MKQIKNLIIDMDGVLWNGVTPTTDLGALFTKMHEHEIGFVMATNNATKTTQQYVDKFASLGAVVEPWQIVTSAQSTASYLAEHYPKGTTVYILGGDGLHQAMHEHGFTIINDEHPEVPAADFIGAKLCVVGLMWDATYSDFCEATLHINAGAKFYGTNPDSSYPNERGRLPGAGSYLALLMTATGERATVIGKPNRPMYIEALKRVGGTTENTAMIGDRLGTDIEGANNVGLTSVLVLTGISTREDVKNRDIVPTIITESIEHFVAELTQQGITT